VARRPRSPPISRRALLQHATTIRVGLFTTPEPSSRTQISSNAFRDRHIAQLVYRATEPRARQKYASSAVLRKFIHHWWEEVSPHLSLHSMNANFKEGRVARGCIGCHPQRLPGRPITKAACSDVLNLSNERRLTGRCRTDEMATNGTSSGRQDAGTQGEVAGLTSFFSRSCIGYLS
jgi:hypothetical protein